MNKTFYKNVVTHFNLFIALPPVPITVAYGKLLSKYSVNLVNECQLWDTKPTLVLWTQEATKQKNTVVLSDKNIQINRSTVYNTSPNIPNYLTVSYSFQFTCYFPKPIYILDLYNEICPLIIS